MATQTFPDFSCKMGLLGAKYIALSLFKVKISVSVTEMELLNLCDQCLHLYFSIHKTLFKVLAEFVSLLVKVVL